MNRSARLRVVGILGGIAACGLIGGCRSSETVKCDRLAAQTSRPGWVVGDAVGMAMASKNESIAQSYMRSEDVAVASVPDRD